MSTSGLRLALALLLAGCGSSSEEKPAPDKPSPVVNKKPRGADAYDGERKVESDGLGKAADGVLLAATDGAELTLATAREAGPVLLVFYRGHW